MFPHATRRTVFRLLVAALILAGLACAARLGEAGQLYSTGAVSMGLFALAGLILYYALLVAWIVFRRHLRSRRR